jgi:hypothetical protein
MTWKSTAFASGLAVVGTWLASLAPMTGPGPETSVIPTPERTETAAIEIQREADRLHERLRQVAAYRQPDRNPFRFVEPGAPLAAPTRQPIVTVEEMPEGPPAPPTLRVTLSGIGEDTVDNQIVRTAFISTPDNVFLVKVGDAVADMYKVSSIGPDAVELTRLDDGATVRLALKQTR